MHIHAIYIELYTLILVCIIKFQILGTAVYYYVCKRIIMHVGMCIPDGSNVPLIWWMWR